MSDEARPLVKICGISEPRHARLAAAYGADFIGVVFAPSRRQVTIGQAKRIASALRRNGSTAAAPRSTGDIEEVLRGRRPLLVGVFADQDADTINGIADECALDIVQLSGSEPWGMCAAINRAVLKCMKVREGEEAPAVLANVQAGGILLLDPFVEGTYGGTGRKLDWRVAAEVARAAPVVLAGGLTPANVSAAAAEVRPWAVDVSSGVETDGVKDPEKIRSFIAAVKERSAGIAKASSGR